MTARPHLPVMLSEVTAALAPAPGKIVVDGTFGAGGYTRALLSAGAEVIAIDRDPTAIAAGGGLVAEAAGRLTLVEGRFGDLDRLAGRAVDGVVLDVGVSSMQLDRAERGFSFRFDGPLDMRMEAEGPTAADVVARLEPRDLSSILWQLGEERQANRIARAVAEARKDAPITTTRALAEIVARTIGRGPKDEIHPATRTFQALRIFVNRELDQLAEALAAAERALVAGGRLVVVAFHSLEDRIVKRFLADRSRERPGGSRHAPETSVPPATFRPLAKGAVEPSAAEVASNPRARSAKLRAAERLAGPARPIDLVALGVPDLGRLHAALGQGRA